MGASFPFVRYPYIHSHAIEGASWSYKGTHRNRITFKRTTIPPKSIKDNGIFAEPQFMAAFPWRHVVGEKKKTSARAVVECEWSPEMKEANFRGTCLAVVAVVHSIFHYSVPIPIVYIYI